LRYPIFSGVAILIGISLFTFGQDSESTPEKNNAPIRSGHRGLKTGAALAATPPMGWNSWDGYGTTIDEKEVKLNAAWLAQHLKPFGWKYVTVDMEWFVTNPIPEGNSKSAKYTLDAYGRYTPADNRFNSAKGGAGFKPLADYVHSLGLKFGIHILRGIPKEAVEKNLPIEGSSFHAKDAADTSDSCVWNPDNFGMDGSKPAAQAYYDSIARLYAKWGVDLIKVDCIAFRPYKADEIRALSQALQKTGRPIVLSLSPGPSPIEKADELLQYAHMWRISNDIWDIWHSDVEYPQGLGDQFAMVAKWSSLAQPGHWPDADMLPFGYLGPAPGWGKPRQSRLSHDEQRSFLTLWCIFRSPLMVGGRLPSADEWTTKLLTNAEVLAVDQQSTSSKLVVNKENLVVWRAESAKGSYVAAFNLTNSPQKVQASWQELGLPAGSYQMRDLWAHQDLGSAQDLSVELPAHGSVLYLAHRPPQHATRHQR
jgi:alpha-galactosidase